MKQLENFIRNQDGVTAIEYALIASLIAMFIIAAVQVVGTKVSGVFSEIGNSLKLREDSAVRWWAFWALDLTTPCSNLPSRSGCLNQQLLRHLDAIAAVPFGRVERPIRAGQQWGNLALPERGGVKPHTQGDRRLRATPFD